jgi:hypothetical protein
MSRLFNFEGTVENAYLMFLMGLVMIYYGNVPGVIDGVLLLIGLEVSTGALDALA